MNHPAASLAQAGLLAGLLLANSVHAAETPPPALEVVGDDFPDLIVLMPRFTPDGTQLPLACDQVRPRRIDELDPSWRRAVGRIHLDCESMATDEDDVATVATVITAFLNPGAVRMASLPVAEIRLMDSDLWSDHQYVLPTPYRQAGERLRKHVEQRCRVAQDSPGLIGLRNCRVTDEDDGMFIQTGAIGGIWVHPDPLDPQRTVYAESWAD